MDHTDPLASRILLSAGVALTNPELSMEALAAEAGVSRATLYRRFPNRQVLIEALVDSAIEELASRIAEADLNSVSTDSAIERVSRAFLLAAERYSVVQAAGKTAEQDARFAADVIAPIRSVIERGIANGELNADLRPEVALHLFAAMLAAGVSLRTELGVGTEAAAAHVAGVFLHGCAE